MTDGPDHIVHAVRDLDAAGELYRRAGFTVGARNVHPWGTHNRIVQLRDVYIELLAVAEPERIVEPSPRAFSFGAYHRDYLGEREGLAMVLLKSSDAGGDALRFRAAGIGDFDVFGFSRSGKGPDGAPVTLAFSLAYAVDTASPNAGFAVCQHHHQQEYFWSPLAQQHANGAGHVASVVMVAERPFAHQPFLQAWTGVSATAERGGIAVRMPTGLIEIITPAEFQDRFGVSIKAGEGAQFAALRFTVDDIGSVAGALEAEGLAFARAGDALVLSPETAFGAALVFTQAEASNDTAPVSMA